MGFSFVHITDHHLCETEATLRQGFSPSYAFRAVMRHIAENVASRADFIITTGDLVEPDTDTAYETLRQMLNLHAGSEQAPGPRLVSIEGLRDFPMYFLPGNHDDRDKFFRHLFPQTTPRPLMNVAFPHKGIEFVCLDWGAQSKAIAHSETLGFLARALQRGLPSILIMHHHVEPIGSRWLDNFIADEVGRFWEIVAGQNVLGIFCGHVHITYEKLVEGIPVFGLRSTAFPMALQDEPMPLLQPPHYRFVTVQDGILTTRIFEVPL